MIVIVRFMPRQVGARVFGSRVTHPALNVLYAFFGLGQTILPRRSFARFLLMVLILFSLIIRTAYQGKSFEFLQQDMRKKDVQTIAELLEKNYTLYAYKSLLRYWAENELT